MNARDHLKEAALNAARAVAAPDHPYQFGVDFVPPENSER